MPSTLYAAESIRCTLTVISTATAQQARRSYAANPASIRNGPFGTSAELIAEAIPCR